MVEQVITINNRKIGHGQPVYIIAEAGVNHNGDIGKAREMISIAKTSGADAIKFQTFKTELLASKHASAANYQKQNANVSEQYNMLKSLELSFADFEELYNLATKEGIQFLSTPFDMESALFLNQIGIPLFKISSGELTNIPLLRLIAETNKPIILSTGMSSLDEIQLAVETIQSSGNQSIILLHCTSNYPTELKDVNLRAMTTIQTKFHCPVGYSDHTEGIDVAIAAVAMGAVVIEKHFTIDKLLPGPDHLASLNGDELSKMVCSIRNIEIALGSSEKNILEIEINVKQVIQKSCVIIDEIKKGDVLTYKTVGIKRPGGGISPSDYEKVIGKKVNTDIRTDTVLTWEMLL